MIMACSPSKTYIRTVDWLSAAVEKLRMWSVNRVTSYHTNGNSHLALARGVTVLRGMSLVKTTPVVSIPKDKGVASTRRTSPSVVRRENATLNGGTVGNGLIGFDSLEGSLLKKSLRSC